MSESNNALEKQLKSLETSLFGADMDKDKQDEMRMAVLKQAMSEMTDEEKKEARKAMGENPDHKKKMDAMKKAMEKEDPEEMRTAMKKAMDMPADKEDDSVKKARKQAQDEADDKEKKAKKQAQDNEKDQNEKMGRLVASMNTITNKPLIDEMLVARAKKGATAEQLTAFRKSLYGKTAEEVQARYDEDKLLYETEKPLMASVQTESPELPFNGISDLDVTSLSANTNEDETLEAMYN